MSGPSRKRPINTDYILGVVSSAAPTRQRTHHAIARPCGMDRPSRSNNNTLWMGQYKLPPAFRQWVEKQTRETVSSTAKRICRAPLYELVSERELEILPDPIRQIIGDKTNLLYPRRLYAVLLHYLQKITGHRSINVLLDARLDAEGNNVLTYVTLDCVDWTWQRFTQHISPDWKDDPMPRSQIN